MIVCLVSSSAPNNRFPPRWPAVRGGLLALTAAVLFGISTPLVQKFGSGVGAFTTAALLYAGAAIAGALLRQRVDREARVVSGDIRRLLAMAAAGAVVVHNHPSGDPTPSAEDVELTRRLRTVGEILGIPIVDHVVVGDRRFTSIGEWIGTGP